MPSLCQTLNCVYAVDEAGKTPLHGALIPEGEMDEQEVHARDKFRSW